MLKKIVDFFKREPIPHRDPNYVTYSNFLEVKSFAILRGNYEWTIQGLKTVGISNKKVQFLADDYCSDFLSGISEHNPEVIFIGRLLSSGMYIDQLDRNMLIKIRKASPNSKLALTTVCESSRQEITRAMRGGFDYVVIDA